MSDMATEYALRPFTVDEYHRLAKIGVLREGERVELLDGLIVEMSPIGLNHWERHAHIVRALLELLGTRSLVIGQGSFPLGPMNEPQPDIAILESKSYVAAGRPPVPHEIYAFVEIADTSLKKDLGPKLRLYGRQHVADYLVVDLDANVLVHCSQPHAMGYRRIDRLGYGDTLRLSRLPDVEIRADVFLAERLA